jgi:hypothetical protein
MVAVKAATPVVSAQGLVSGHSSLNQIDILVLTNAPVNSTHP